MNVLAISILVFLTARTLVSLVNLLSRANLSRETSSFCPKVSVLVPARNEEENIARLIESIVNQDYPDVEIIVCNDHSTDSTGEILARLSATHASLSCFIGDELPEGWVGKNFACHQLAQKATGRYFIFLDADVELEAHAIGKAVSFFHENHLSLLSLFPRQRMESLGEWLTVPLMNWILQSLLPMILVQKSRFSSLSAANGQFMMFDADSYLHNEWHKQVRAIHVEDLGIARLVKREGLKMAIVLSRNEVYCRMYKSFNEAVTGFSRNMHEFFGGHRLLMIVFVLFILGGPFLVAILLGMRCLCVFILLVVINRLFVAWANGQNAFLSVLFHPLQMCAMAVIAATNIFRKARKEITWKDRKINI